MSHKQSASQPELPSIPSIFGERETAFEQLLDRLAKRFEIADREGLKIHIEFAATVYGGHPDRHRLSIDDLDQLRDLAPKMAAALRRNASAIAHIIMEFEEQRGRGFKPELFWRPLDQGDVDDARRQVLSHPADDFITHISEAPRRLMELAHVLSHYHPGRGRPSSDAGLRGAVGVLQLYWRDTLGRRVKAEPWKRGMFGEFLKAVFEFIDPAAVGQLPSAMKRARARTSEKNTL